MSFSSLLYRFIYYAVCGSKSIGGEREGEH
jgi:hypothetical protein